MLFPCPPYSALSHTKPLTHIKYACQMFLPNIIRLGQGIFAWFASGPEILPSTNRAAIKIKREQFAPDGWKMNYFDANVMLIFSKNCGNFNPSWQVSGTCSHTSACQHAPWASGHVSKSHMRIEVWVFSRSQTLKGPKSTYVVPMSLLTEVPWVLVLGF